MLSVACFQIVLLHLLDREVMHEAKYSNSSLRNAMCICIKALGFVNKGSLSSHYIGMTLFTAMPTKNNKTRLLQLIVLDVYRCMHFVNNGSLPMMDRRQYRRGLKHVHVDVLTFNQL